jgi:hypothetical protein
VNSLPLFKTFVSSVPATAAEVPVVKAGRDQILSLLIVYRLFESAMSAPQLRQFEIHQPVCVRVTAGQ